MAFACENCGNYFSTKQSLKRHQNKKIPCTNVVPEKVDGRTCEWCGKIFAQRSGKYKHIPICRVKKNQTTIKQLQREKENQKLAQDRQNVMQEIAELRQEMVELREEHEKLRDTQGKQIVNGNVNNTNNVNGDVYNVNNTHNINIINHNYVVDGKVILKNFTSPNTKHVTPEMAVRLVLK